MTRKTSAWGRYAILHFIKMVCIKETFTNVPIEIEADPGDVLTFYEGWFQFYRRIEVTEDTKEITIINSKNCNTFLYLCRLIFNFNAIIPFRTETFDVYYC